MKLTTRMLGILRFLKQRGECTPYNIVNETDLFRNTHYPRCVKDLEKMRKDNLVKKRQEFSDRTRKHVNRNWWSVTDRGLDVLESHVGKEIDPEPKLRQLLQAIESGCQTCYQITKELKGNYNGNSITSMQERISIRVRDSLITGTEREDKVILYKLTDKGKERLEKYQL